MIPGTRFILILALMGIACEGKSYGDTRFEAECTCPLCATKFTAILAGSGTQFGRRLDLRPLGAIASPWPVAVCTKCKFVLYEDDKKYTDAELQKLRTFVNGEEYRKLPADTPSYERVARLSEVLGATEGELAMRYLEASWEVEDQKARNEALLEKCRKILEKSLNKGPKEDRMRLTHEFLYGELLRRLGKFEEAGRYFDGLVAKKEFEKEPYPDLIAQERKLIEAKDAEPQEMGSKK